MGYKMFHTNKWLINRQDISFFFFEATFGELADHFNILLVGYLAFISTGVFGTIDTTYPYFYT